MKVTCGTDIIEINRVKECLESMEEKFATRVFTKDEIKYCESKKMQKYQHYAARFAAKEAVFKAISFCLKDKYSICWKDIEVINDAQGRPQVNLSVENLKQIDSIDLSLSHCKEYATANVVVVWR
jgi:holo-[acyl-carrier protein] synthase